MDMEILEKIKSNMKWNGNDLKNFKIPKDIDITCGNGKICLYLSAKAVGVMEDKKNFNMQEDAAAFEGWALIIYTYYAKEKGLCIQLGMNKEAKEHAKKFTEIDKFFGKRGHYYRFLYRALRFSEQYSWFILDEELKGLTQAFKQYLRSGSVFTNNYPNGEKKEAVFPDNEKVGENDIEGLFALRKPFGMQMFRQLPVGLFENEKKKETSIFTGRKSAIDLWSAKDDKFIVYELKWKNKMIGIITELFFYCNFVRDMYGAGEEIAKNHFECHKVNINRIQNKEKYRGYYNICSRKFQEIRGNMLYDKGNLHPAITKKLLEEMNQAQFVNHETPTKYGLIEYTEVQGNLEVISIM